MYESGSDSEVDFVEFSSPKEKRKHENIMRIEKMMEKEENEENEETEGENKSIMKKKRKRNENKTKVRRGKQLVMHELLFGDNGMRKLINIMPAKMLGGKQSDLVGFANAFEEFHRDLVPEMSLKEQRGLLDALGNNGAVKEVVHDIVSSLDTWTLERKDMKMEKVLGYDSVENRTLKDPDGIVGKVEIDDIAFVSNDSKKEIVNIPTNSNIDDENGFAGLMDDSNRIYDDDVKEDEAILNEDLVMKEKEFGGLVFDEEPYFDE